MPGVKESTVYTGPEGRVVCEDGSYFTQYRAVRQTSRGPQAKRFDTPRGAVAWLKRMAAKRAATL